MVTRMQNEQSIYRLASVSTAFHLLASCAILVGSAHAQATESGSDKGPHGKSLEAISSLKTGAFGPVTEQQVADARAGQLVPMLEARFAATQDADLKMRIACALVKLGDTADAYWNELEKQAAPAAESDAPDPRCLGERERCRASSSPEYAAWAKTHNVSPGSPEEIALLGLPGKLEILASTGDPRGVPLLRRALQSPNYEIESVAAEGLAEAHDKDSIPLIIEACRRAPASMVRLLAEYLKWFDDPLAKSAADAYLPKVPDPIEALRHGDLAPAFIERIAAAREVQAVPILEEQFALSQDAITKAHIASALVRLGDTGETYWDYLVGQARIAAENDAPSVIAFDSHGRVSPEASPEFVAWARKHALSIDTAKANAMIWLPRRVLFLALTGDPRAVPILRKALWSSNFFIQGYAANGLAYLQDKGSIPLIIHACERAPAEAATTIAKALVYFDDSQAQSAVDRYMTQDTAKAYRDARARGVGPFGEKLVR